ncbi:MAG: D-amino-acid transaminase [Anderseniella sp.]|jgi:D-alanine transaminase|nr:D-amino-acid transaminase [Anderseniella sp.]
MSRTVFVNGEYLPEGEAKVSIFDRGFVFGDGIYEVVPVIGGKMVDKAPFLERLKRSLGELRIDMPMSEDEFVAMHEQLIKLNGIDEGGVYSQITRGVADRDFAFPAPGTRPSVAAFTMKKQLIDNANARTGVKVVTVEDIRWKRRDIKSIALLGQVMAKQAAVEKGAFEGWMVEDGYVTEGTSSTAYIVKDGVIITRPLSNEILPGIRRKVIKQLCAEKGVKLEERLFTVEEALAADEAFLSSATTLVMPIIEIDGQQIGGGQPGPVARQMREYYIAAIKEEAGLA